MGAFLTASCILQSLGSRARTPSCGPHTLGMRSAPCKPPILSRWAAPRSGSTGTLREIFISKRCLIRRCSLCGRRHSRLLPSLGALVLLRTLPQEAFVVIPLPCVAISVLSCHPLVLLLVRLTSIRSSQAPTRALRRGSMPSSPRVIDQNSPAPRNSNHPPVLETKPTTDDAQC